MVLDTDETVAYFKWHNYAPFRESGADANLRCEVRDAAEERESHDRRDSIPR